MSAADEPVGIVRLAASNSLSAILTAPVVARFRDAYPQVSVHVTENTSMIVRENCSIAATAAASVSSRGRSVAGSFSRTGSMPTTAAAPRAAIAAASRSA